MRKRIDLSLYLVLDPDLCGGAEGMVRTAQLAAKNGATAVQLRAPEWKKRQWLSTARDLKTVLAPFGVPLIINDQVDVALMVKADGVHVGQDDLPVAGDVVVGMKPGDPLPLDVSRLPSSAFVGEVVMAQEITPFLAAARACGCVVQVGTDMLFEQIPAYLEFFGLPSTTAEDLRAVAQLA